LSEQAERGITRTVAGMIKVEERPGYWTTLLGLLTAAGLALVSLAQVRPKEANTEPE
jgi:hypothetical protein